MKSISLDIPKKLSAVVALAGAPNPIIFLLFFFSALIFLITLSLNCLIFSPKS